MKKLFHSLGGNKPNNQKYRKKEVDAWIEDLRKYLHSIIVPAPKGGSKPYLPLGKEAGAIWLAGELLRHMGEVEKEAK